MDAVEIRRAREDDAAGIAAIHIRSWQVAYRGILSGELLDGLSASERERSWRTILGETGNGWLTLVAEGKDEGIVGFCSVATPRGDADADALTAEVGALYVDPDRWRRGAGSALLTAAMENLGQGSIRDVVLWVLPENQAALALYERFGFEIEAGVEKREERSGRPVIRLRASLPPAPSS